MVTHERPIFLVSPPGSEEAKDIGYINIPKIVKDPPPELTYLHSFQDNTGRQFSSGPSHVWVLKSYIADLGRSLDVIIPLFPRMLQYAVPWIVCEYALERSEEGSQTDLMLFTKHIIKRRTSDWNCAGIILHEKRWRKARKPMHYLRVAIEREVEKERTRSDTMFNEETISLDEPIITGNLTDNDEITYWDIISESNSEAQSFCDELDIKDILVKACKEANLSNNAEKLLITSLNFVNRADAAKKLEFSHTKYKTLCKEIERSKLREIINSRFLGRD